jgi:ornithine carbamoyltransferase
MAGIRHFTSIDDLSSEEVLLLLKLAEELRSERNRGITRDPLPGKSLAMIFEKPSLRTRMTFDVGMSQLGGHAFYLAPSEIQIGERESVEDVARNLSRWVDGIMARTFSHETVLGLVEHGSVPVINALSDIEHPCQALAFGQLVLAERGSLEGATVAFIGDGNNVAHSLMLLAAKTGMRFTLACPEGYDPDAAFIDRSREIGGDVALYRDPAEAVAGADYIYTDVWTSMGQEAEKQQRLQDFEGYQVNSELVSKASDGVLVTHCLPAHRGEEITAEVIDGERSRAFDEAENRLHAQKAVLLYLMAPDTIEEPGR